MSKEQRKLRMLAQKEGLVGARMDPALLRGMVDAFLARHLHDQKKYQVLPPWPSRDRIGEVGISKSNQVKPLPEGLEEV